MLANRFSLTGVLRHLMLILLVTLTLFPIYFVLVNSLKNPVQFASDFWTLPNDLQWGNYPLAWATVARPMLNSSIIVFSSTVAIVAFAALSAYAFALLDFPGRKVIFNLIFALLLIPSFLTLIPLYLQIKQLGLSDYFALIPPYVAAGQALSIFVLKSFFENVSREILEAAQIDGAGEWRIFRSIVLPLSVPILITVFIINFIPLWNDYLLPQLLLDRDYQTVTMALITFQGSAATHTAPRFGPLLAAYVVSSLPLVAVLTFLMRYYIEGLTSGSVKM